MDLLVEPSSERQFIMYEALRKGAGVEELHPKDLYQALVHRADEGAGGTGGKDPQVQRKGIFRTTFSLQAKKDGFADRYLAKILGIPEEKIRRRRTGLGVVEAGSRCRSAVSKTPPTTTPPTMPRTRSRASAATAKVMVLGGGPNRIGQGIEFDYCCVHAAFALRDEGYESIMVNCNPETVSTDYDTSDKLYFEPLTVEDVLSIYEKEKPDGVIVQFGGQTPLNIARELAEAGVKILGTSPDTIDLAEDRDRFRKMMEKLGIPMPESGMASTLDEAMEVAEADRLPAHGAALLRSGRPGHGGGPRRRDARALCAGGRGCDAGAADPDRQVPGQRHRDARPMPSPTATDAFVPAVMEHIELAGIHSGDSACVIPPISIPARHMETINEYTAEDCRGAAVSWAS